MLLIYGSQLVNVYAFLKVSEKLKKVNGREEKKK